MRFVHQRRPDPFIDVSPMIDVVFQLVLFFMVTTTFITNPGIQVELPRSSAQIVTSTEDDLQVWMTTDGSVYVNDNPVTESQLKDAFRRRAQANPNTQVVMKADQGVSHGRFVAVIDVARNEGLQRIAIATEVNQD